MYNAVAEKSIDAGAVSITPWEKAVERNGDVYRVLSKSDPIPRNAVVAGVHVPESLIQQLLVILKEAESDPSFQQDDAILKGFLLKDDSFYDIVRKARNLR